MMVGIPPGKIEFDAQAFNLGAKTLMATQGHTNQDLREVIDLRARGLLRTAETITHRLPFREIDKGIEILESQEGDPGRMALHPQAIDATAGGAKPVPPRLACAR